MEEKLFLEIVTPERLLVSEEVDDVTIPGMLGEFGVLPAHTPFLTALKPGEISYRKKDKRFYLSLSSGYAEVRADKVIILAEAAERPSEIDASRAEQAKERALARLKNPTAETDLDRASSALARADVRLQVSKKES
jgi:F-type H+-transporting ATPase subunit epsilon